MDGPALGDLELASTCILVDVEHLADDVEDLALGDVADRHRDAAPVSLHLLAAHQAVGRLQGDGANDVVAEVLGDLERDLAARRRPG